MYPDDTTSARITETSGRRSRRSLRALAGTLAMALCATGLAVLSAAPAVAAPASSGPRDPIASTPKFLVRPEGLHIYGWAFDPDQPKTNLGITAVMDGTRTLGRSVTRLANNGVVQRYGSGPTPGFAFTVAVPKGNHTVCVVLDNLGGGERVVKSCVAVPLGRTLTNSQQQRQSPKGAIQSATTTPGSVRLTGWTSDPDLVDRRSTVVVYLDGYSAATGTTDVYPGARPAGAGRMSRFDISVPASRATHIACVWVVNVGFGSNTGLGCRALDTRSSGAVPASAGTPATPALNNSVVALATKQVGKPYVWGATGPRSFDCSGLVMWAYGKYGYQTPRVSQDQIKSARLISASRAVPGDLVFYHDEVGDVYHVGIYLKPGLSVAAISTDQGVGYQKIWDVNAATYGSFTHT